jgi:cobalamin biosynthesis Mg chelatase CobN
MSLYDGIFILFGGIISILSAIIIYTYSQMQECWKEVEGLNTYLYGLKEMVGRVEERIIAMKEQLDRLETRYDRDRDRIQG